MSDDLQELSSREIDFVGGGVAPLVGYYGLRIGGGALVGAAGGIANELAGDGLQWSDWGRVGASAAAGALGGGGYGMFRHADRVLDRLK